MFYPIVIHKDPDTAYGVTVPDLPGCFSAGDTMQEAVQNAMEAIECHVEGILIDNEELPIAKDNDFSH
ncbi:MAG: type II toxin-antitoxin system HicB family antitoxin [Cyanobacteria bacterium J06642_3]